MWLNKKLLNLYDEILSFQGQLKQYILRLCIIIESWIYFQMSRSFFEGMQNIQPDMAFMDLEVKKGRTFESAGRLALVPHGNCISINMIIIILYWLWASLS